MLSYQSHYYFGKKMITKYILLIALIISSIQAKEIKPAFILKSKGIINDFVIDNAKLYVANDMGSIEIFDLYKQKLIDEIKLKPLKTGRNDYVYAKIISVDRYKGKTLIVSTAIKGYRNVWIHDGKKLKNIINSNKKLTVREARFIDENNFMLATVGYELALYNTTDNYPYYTNHMEPSAFSDIHLSRNKQVIASASESGNVMISDVKTGKLIQILDSQNVDNIYSVAYSKGTVITGGKDRRVGVYQKNTAAYHIKSNFFVYSVSITPSAKFGIYSSGLDNDLQLFNIKTKEKTHRLIGHEAIPTTIKFINDKELFSSGYENKIFYWKLY